MTSSYSKSLGSAFPSPRRTTMIFLRAGSSGITSTIFFLREGLVINTFASLSATRSLTASGPKAEKSGPITQPALSVPRMPIYISGTRSRKKKTRSPFWRPRFLTRMLANLLLSCDRSWKLYSSPSPLLLSHIKAFLSLRFVFKCASMATCAMLICSRSNQSNPRETFSQLNSLTILG